ncbi:outer membrane protein assembly factor BamB family protein [Haloarchaeobius amylolyticus]|uniref:outer membrane protein assembly factor BamB family protein n=1 Tax=Haloarchaeobius amylolyticus TaxID=1198296 RepID=UPI00226DB785|nr:PQQ-binding-like beta-propeller repeat protein [Haloarchaeobius amylolyticus]
MSRNPISRREAFGAIAGAGSLALAGCVSSVLPGNSVDPVWRHDLDQATGASPPAMGDDQVLVGGQDKALYGLGVADGETQFRVETGGPIEARPVAPDAGGPYHVHSTDGDLYTVDPSGARRWHTEGLHERGVLGRYGSLVVDIDLTDDVLRGYDAGSGERRFERESDLYLPPEGVGDHIALQQPAETDEHRLVVLAQDGSVQWQTEPSRLYPNVGADSRLLVATRGPDVTGYDPADGTVRWTGSVAGMEAFHGVELGSLVYLRPSYSGPEDEVVALERDTGHVRWRRTAGYRVEAIEPTDDAVFVGSSVDDPDGGTLARVDCFGPDGTQRWTTVTERPTMEDVVVSGDSVVAVSKRSLAALDRETGETRWTYDPGEGGRLAVVRASGSVFVSNLDRGRVAKLPTM